MKIAVFILFVFYSGYQKGGLTKMIFENQNDCYAFKQKIDDYGKKRIYAVGCYEAGKNGWVK